MSISPSSSSVSIIIQIPTIEEKHLLLKQSLSETLSRYRHFAGKIKHSFSIECDDEGAEYVEARVKSDLSKFLTRPHLPLLNKLLPDNLTGQHAASFQVPEFGCGGIVVASLITHMIVDAYAYATFLEDWASNSISHPTPPPIFDFSSPLAQNCHTYPTVTSLHALFMKMGKHVAARFVFSASSIAKLKSVIVEAATVPTRVEAVSVLIWKRIVAAFRQNSGVEKAALLSHIVNLRARAEPKYSERCVGNFSWVAAAKCMDEDDYKEVLWKLRGALRRIDSGFVKKLQEFSFSNIIILSDTSCGHGIEALIMLNQEDMDLLTKDK